MLRETIIFFGLKKKFSTVMGEFGLLYLNAVDDEGRKGILVYLSLPCPHILIILSLVS